jgi:hypothetical protein
MGETMAKTRTEISNGDRVIDSRDVIARIDELESLIADDEISEENGADVQLDDEGKTKVEMATCGECGKSCCGHESGAGAGWIRLQVGDAMSNYKFTPGQVFKLSPNARISYLAFANMDGSCVQALRLDSEVGQKIYAWLMAGGDKSNKPATYQEVARVAHCFWPHDLETAELS